MKHCIDLNTQLGANAKNDFEKDFFKLIDNFVFGKTMETTRNRINIRHITNEKSAEKLVAKPNFRRLTIFDENLVAVRMKIQLVVKKPVYLGMSIPYILKPLMYGFH